MIAVKDRDIFDIRNFGDHLRYNRASACPLALKMGYKYLAWHNGCIYDATTGEIAFQPDNNFLGDNNATFAGWKNGMRYEGLNRWLTGCQNRAFALIPLRV